MPSALRAQVALLGLLAVLLIPISTSSLRGLTHILTCREEATSPFSLAVTADAPPIISSSAVITRDPTGRPSTNQVCGGLTLDLEVGSTSPKRAAVTLTITNNTDFGWRGSVQLRVDDTDVPIDIGQIDAGAHASDTFDLRLDEGKTYALEGDLLIGP